jgi:FtsH-binding integral membrane protein
MPLFMFVGVIEVVSIVFRPMSLSLRLLGNIFAGAMALFASVAILYNTSNVLHHYRPDQHVAAALSLFSSVALLFWYILRIFMSRD